jgi:Ca2+-binding EF-hand superfamily protein
MNTVSSGSASCNDIEGLHIVHTQGKTFTPLTIEIAEYSLGTSYATPVSFFGTKANGEQVNFTVTLDGVRDGPGGQPDFQKVTFPAEFTDLVQLDVPAKLWSCDNFVFSTIIPPPLPPDQKLAPDFRQGRTLYTEVIEDVLLVGPDFHYASGYHEPASTKFLTTEIPFSFSTPGVSFDADSRDLYFVSNQTIRRYRDHVITDLITLQQVVNAGYDVQWLFSPCGSADQVYFAGANKTGSDFYMIFQLDPNEGVVPVVTPDTLLPGPAGADRPYYFPGWMTARETNFAFDTSLRGSWQTDRVFASWNGGPIQEVLAVGDTGPLGPIPAINGLEFDDDGNLMVQTGNAVLVCHPDGTIESEVPTVVYPVKTGKAVSGKVIREPDGSIFLQTVDEIYRKYGDDFYRVIGEGDLIDGEPIRFLRYLDKPLTSPLRIIVEVRLPSAPTDRHVELLLNQEPSAKLTTEIWTIAALDLNADQYLSWEEWRELSVDPAMPGLFEWINADNSGELDYTELVSAMGSKQNRLLNRWMPRLALAAELDRDGDYRISREEIGLMWKPGTSAAMIDRYLLRTGAVLPMAPQQWLGFKAPKISTYTAAKSMRAQRRAAAAELDADKNGRIDHEEFVDLFSPSTKRGKIDKAWRAATGTAKGETAPEDLSIEDFIEAPSLPKLPKI